jgi:hypothetical protein
LIWSVALAGDQEDEGEPTAENLWRAQQAGDFEKAAGIRAIMDKKSERFWGGRWDQDNVAESPVITPPEADDAFFMPSSWGNDETIILGTTANGISTDYDFDANVYAARCTTHSGTPNARIRVYKSTDGGSSWPYLCGLYIVGGANFSYPVVLTGTSGVPDKLYIFYLQSTGNGDISLARFTLDGDFEDFFAVKVDSDTITYFTVCGNFGSGDTLMLAYQRERPGDTTPNVYTIVSTDRGATWGSQVYITGDGSHPDIAYGIDGYVYMVYTKTGGTDDEITACRSSDYGVSWGEFEALTADTCHDDYAKVAALHTSPPSNQHVWVGYNHNRNNSGDWSMRFAYSTNAGANWSKDHVLASDEIYDEIACDLWVARKTNVTYTNICYLRARRLSLYQGWFDIYWGYSNTGDPGVWKDNIDVTENWAALSYDGRQVCQGTYPGLDSPGGTSGVVYAGQTPFDNFEGLYFDSRAWTDVEEGPGQEAKPSEFTLAHNYPNPFNPATNIAYFLPRACQVKLEVFNILGQKIRTLVDEDQTAGNRQVNWDGRNQAGEEVASGVYFYKLEAEEFTETKKMVLMR